jgi:hypothetical protein
MPKVEQETQGGQAFLKAFKNISARLVWEARDQTETNQSIASTADLTKKKEITVKNLEIRDSMAKSK